MVIAGRTWWRRRQQRLIVHALLAIGLAAVARLIVGADDDVVGLLRDFRLGSDRRLCRRHRLAVVVVKHAVLALDEGVSAKAPTTTTTIVSC